MFDIKEHLKTLPAQPGVYLMKDKYENIIYVGKAISLKNRVRQYFQSSKNHTSKVRSMVSNIVSFEYIITDSELEALILECNLIKRYKPKYNVLLRDDKTYPYIKVTVQEDYPRIMKVRKVLKDKAKYFGPYTNVTAVNDTLEVIRDVYPIRSCNIDIDRAIENKMRPCLNYHIKKCSGPCTGNVSKEEYMEMVDEILYCLSGKEEKLIDILTGKMNVSAEQYNYEDAAMYRDRIRSLEELVQKQKIVSAGSDINQDVIAMARAHDEACVQVFFIRNGKIVGREHYILQGVLGSQRSAILGSFVKQFYMSQEYIPKELIIEDEIEDGEIVEEWLTDKKGQKVSVRVPQKGEKKNLVEMVRKNAIEYLEKFSDTNSRVYQKSMGALEELKKLLDLEKLPNRIESFDISNIQGVDSIGTMVVYTGGKKDKKEYRRYKIKTVEGPDDYSSMAEIVERRLKYGSLPDLMLLDGGKGQVSAVKRILDTYGLDIPLWGMYKDDYHRTKGLVNAKAEIELDKTSNLYRFVAGIQEEVHHYAISYHRSLRDKKMTKSVLDDIKGIGSKRKKSLLSHFQGVDAIKSASLEQLIEVEGMNKGSATAVYEFFHKIK
ncbi:MAG: excinuclease ABC subunit UvrC [Clostridioides sp.]|jgi:excinuclease ABC subunit C|nr:excinuclease ABC subunit UvrC [Clostridioides sp.]